MSTGWSWSNTEGINIDFRLSGPYIPLTAHKLGHVIVYDKEGICIGSLVQLGDDGVDGFGVAFGDFVNAGQLATRKHSSVVVVGLIQNLGNTVNDSFVKPFVVQGNKCAQMPLELQEWGYVYGFDPSHPVRASQTDRHCFGELGCSTLLLHRCCRESHVLQRGPYVVVFELVCGFVQIFKKSVHHYGLKHRGMVVTTENTRTVFSATWLAGTYEGVPRVACAVIHLHGLLWVQGVGLLWVQRFGVV